MFLKFLTFSLFCIQISNQKTQTQNFSPLRDFVCSVAKDELKNHPEIRTISIIELESNFPQTFSLEVLKCLSVNLAKVLIHPHSNFHKNLTIMLPQTTMVIYVADKVRKVS